MYYKRTLSPIIERVSKSFPVVLISGPRQVGKSTVFEKAIDFDRTFISLDDPFVLEAAKSDPSSFFKTYKYPILLDEVQNAPELFHYIKMIVDREKKDGLFWLTGSQAFDLMSNVSESLAGRVAILDMQGFSYSEKRGHPLCDPFLPAYEQRREIPKRSVSEIFKTIFYGSYPKLYCEKSKEWEVFYSSYLRTYIERDVRKLVNISQEHLFIKFMRILAARTAQIVNYSEIARDVEVSVNTIKSWISILETSGLILLLQPFSANITTRLVKSPKIYFYDTGLVAYLTAMDTPSLLEKGIMAGAVFETYAISEIVKSYIHNGKRINATYFRDEQKEVDLVIESGGLLYPIEIKKTASPNKSDISGILRMKEVLKKREFGLSAVVCARDTPLPIVPDIVAMPVDYI